MILSGCFHVTFISAINGDNQTQMKIIYHDQNNNMYTVTPDSITYTPILKKDSSSGMYSGGSPRSIPLHVEQYNTIIQMAKTLLQNKAGHNVKRIMTTSVLTMVRDTASNSCILLPSAQRLSFEKEIQKYLQN
jgi:hypothetical protein